MRYTRETVFPALLAAAFLAAGCVSNGAGVAYPAVGDAGWHNVFADRTYEAWAAGKVMPQFSQTYPEATLEDGYRVQEAFVESIMEKDAIGGYKAAVVGAGGQQALGVDAPITGVVPASGVLHTVDGIVLDLGDSPKQAVETEIGYVFGDPISAPLDSVEALRPHVEAVVASIEIPGGEAEEVTPGTAADLAARNVNAYKIIIGEPHDPATVDPDALTITLTHDGDVINEAQGNQAAGGQWATLLKTVNNLVGRGYTIQKGHVITNGALGHILPLKTGAYKAEYGPLGVVAFAVEGRRQE